MRIEDNEDDESQIHSPQKNSRPISEIDERTSHKKKKPIGRVDIERKYNVEEFKCRNEKRN